MNVAILYSGGKDSNLTLDYALKNYNVKCLIILISENKESYMFHTPNINLAELQAKAVGIPYILQKTKGIKEKELNDLEKAIKGAIKIYKIQGILTGAICSNYQASRIKDISNKLKIKCINPLWHKDEIKLLKELVNKKFEVIICGVFAEGLENLIGKRLDKEMIAELEKLQNKYKINPSGEGGEIESFVLDAPFFKNKLAIKKSHIIKDSKYSKILIIDKIRLIKK
jgi:ABC transporter with metal-binding/Fe-S-binding domain ATP-binding protein